MNDYSKYQKYQVGEILYNEFTENLYEIAEYIPEIEYGIFNNYKVRNMVSGNIEEMTESYISQRLVSMYEINKRIDNLLNIIDNCQLEINNKLKLKEKFTTQLTLVERKES